MTRYTLSPLHERLPKISRYLGRREGGQAGQVAKQANKQVGRSVGRQARAVELRRSNPLMGQLWHRTCTALHMHTQVYGEYITIAAAAAVVIVNTYICKDFCTIACPLFLRVSNRRCICSAENLMQLQYIRYSTYIHTYMLQGSFE